ncbi:MAG: 2-hydroxyacid dehydrogenase [Negativicutes bacterium]|nr:2-hydroxyacid dehydrogenase [Negativicutes bacterium]MDR3591229.1 2-hydroxyacid dehydrogenase [Negativicutes bacterium]
MPTIVSLLSEEKFRSAEPRVPDGWKILFLNQITDQEIIEACREADCLFAPPSAGPISSFVLENIPAISIVQTMGVGFDHVDIPASIRLGIPVANVPGANATAVAEHAIGALIALQRRMVEADAAIKAGSYLPSRNLMLREGLKEVRESRIGLVGFGNIGRQVARLALVMGASIAYFDPYRQPPEVERQFSAQYKTLDSLLATSDVISLHMPLNEQTGGLIGKRELALMPPGSILINTARGEIVDQSALVDALESGHLAGAAIDTVTPEPPGPEHPLFRLSAAAAKRLLVTPHTAGVTLGAYRRMIEGAIENMGRALSGELPKDIVNGVEKRQIE